MGGTARSWSILTPEYPLGCGGIGDYTRLVAAGLAARGDRVVVHTPAHAAVAETPGVRLDPLPRGFGPATIRALSRSYRALPPETVRFVQYVPQGFGYTGLNVPFTGWLGLQPGRSFVMIHEAVFPFVTGQAWRRDVVAATTRLTLGLITRRAERAFLSTPAWEPLVEHWAPRGLALEWLPIPATIDPGPLALQPWERPTVAHFGTYGALVAEPLRKILVPLLQRNSGLEVRLVGRGSQPFRDELRAAVPGSGERVHATGAASEAVIAEELARAWVVVFPFLEGVTTRRTSLMSALAAGAVVMATDGWCSEAIWRDSGAVSLVAIAEPLQAVSAVEALLGDEPRRHALRVRARELYVQRFHLDRTIERLQTLHG
jgi:glycosyltransferase involved in cell wall biosynthesis